MLSHSQKTDIIVGMLRALFQWSNCVIVPSTLIAASEREDLGPLYLVQWEDDRQTVTLELNELGVVNMLLWRDDHVVREDDLPGEVLTKYPAHPTLKAYARYINGEE